MQDATDTNQSPFQDQWIFVFGDTPVIFYGKEAEYARRKREKFK